MHLIIWIVALFAATSAKNANKSTAHETAVDGNGLTKDDGHNGTLRRTVHTGLELIPGVESADDVNRGGRVGSKKKTFARKRERTPNLGRMSLDELRWTIRYTVTDIETKKTACYLQSAGYFYDVNLKVCASCDEECDSSEDLSDCAYQCREYFQNKYLQSKVDDMRSNFEALRHQDKLLSLGILILAGMTLVILVGLFVLIKAMITTKRVLKKMGAEKC